MAKPRYAIDVSPVNRAMLADKCAGVYAPGDVPALGCRVALCHLVLQHCEDDAVAVLLADVYRALAPGGVFHVQTASFVKPQETGDIMIGGGARPVTTWVRWFVESGFGLDTAYVAGPWGNTAWRMWRLIKP